MQHFKSVLFASAMALAMFSPAFAAGEVATPAETEVAPKSAKAMGCKRGEAVLKEACVTLAPGVMTDDVLFEQGKRLANDNEYDWALEVLALITKQDDAKVLNYIGYSHRKAGRLETGIEAYKKALSIDANYVQARAYLGEAYILAGKKDLAMAELAEIKTRCGADCPEYKELEKSLAAN